jgi:hypothetical protein
MAKQQASLSISAPFACIGKFITERGFQSAAACRGQPNTVSILRVSSKLATAASDQRQNCG